VICSGCGALTWVREKKGALKDNAFTMCCQKGKVIISPLPPIPPLLYDLVNTRNAPFNHFLSKIRAYNCSFQMASSTANIDQVNGLSSFRVLGNVCHRMGPLIHEPGEVPKFAQLYILDLDTQLQIMHGIFNEDLDLPIGRNVIIPKIPMAPSDTNIPFTFTRRQFPINLAFAMTINKSQGQTLKSVGVYLPKPCFAHGQLYVALSRVGDDNAIHVMAANPTGAPVGEGMFTNNVVFIEILSPSPTQ
jgi:hypothetical protein